MEQNKIAKIITCVFRMRVSRVQTASVEGTDEYNIYAAQKLSQVVRFRMPRQARHHQFRTPQIWRYMHMLNAHRIYLRSISSCMSQMNKSGKI